MTELLFFPGMCTDYRLFMRQKDAFPSLKIPHWIPPLSPTESFESYCKRFAETLVITRPFFLGGISMGGMMALEIARYHKPTGIILIASATQGNAVPTHYQLLGKCARQMPERILANLLRLGGFCIEHFPFLPVINQLNPKERQLFAAMIREISPRLVQWQANAFYTWKAPSLNVPIYHIHGTKDALIPYHKVTPTETIDGGEHLINLTHAAYVNQWLLKLLSRVCDD